MTPLRPRYHRAEASSTRDRWLISYTDIVTILLILFVAVAAQGMKARVAAPPPRPTIVSAHGNLLEAERKLKQQGLDLHMEPQGLVISLPQAVLFPSGEDQVSAQALPTLSQIAAVVRETNNKVALVGHADTIPIHNRRFRNNWELSAARSLNLLSLLTAEYGIPESRLSIQSYGSNNPRVSNDTEDGRAANRRVEILILDESAR
jgi:chemotaxis protein MotB